MGDTIEKTQVQAAGKDDVLKALGSAAEKLRRNLGESLASIEKYDAPIQGATTASLDALKSYSLGLATRRRQGDAASVPFFRTAIEQDPNFALAHARLSTIYSNLNESTLSREEILKAYALRDRVSEPERLYILARYYGTIEHSNQKTIDTYQVWNQTYPKEYVPHANLGSAYQSRSDFEKAIEELRTAIALAPDEPLPYANLAGDYQQIGQVDEGRKTLESAIARGLDSAATRTQLYTFAFFQHDARAMAAQVEAANRLPDSYSILSAQAGVAVFQGQLMLAKELTAQYATEVASKTGFKAFAANAWSNLAQAAALYGDAASVRSGVRTSLDIERSIGTVLNSAFALAVAGDLAETRALVDEAKRLPDADSPDVQEGFRLIDAIGRMRRGDPKAVDAMPPPKDARDLSAICAIGIANLEVGDPAVAVERFKQVEAWKLPTTSTLYALSPLYLGRALAKVGKTGDARAAYDRFFERFKSADAALPILVAAKKESARLKPTS